MDTSLIIQNYVQVFIYFFGMQPCLFCNFWMHCKLLTDFVVRFLAFKFHLKPPELKVVIASWPKLRLYSETIVLVTTWLEATPCQKIF